MSIALEPATIELPSGELIRSNRPLNDVISPPDTTGICTVTPLDDEPYAIIPLHGKYGSGLVAKVSICDVELVKRYRWYVNAQGYVLTYKPERCPNRTFHVIFLHRLVLGLQKGDGYKGDHRRHDKLDNRRSKLRIATPFESSANRRKHKTVCGERRFKGVHKSGNMWRATITADEVFYELGGFPTEYEAACAYDRAARYLFGSFAQTNFEGSKIENPQLIRATQDDLKRRKKTSRFWGVSKLNDGGFQAFIVINKEMHYLGYFRCEIAAAKARDAVARYFYGDSTKTNFEGSERMSPEESKLKYKPQRSSSFVGVSKSWLRWVAKIQVGKKRLHLGRFSSEEDAARAYDDARVSHGLLRVNFPDG